MKNFPVLLIISLCLVTDLFSRSIFDEHIIMGNQIKPEEPRAVFVADMDNDGDIDVLSASRGDNKIAWYENTQLGYFLTHSISTEVLGAYDVYAADIDQDGDMDVLAAAAPENKIIWFDNDGNQNFTREQ